MRVLILATLLAIASCTGSSKPTTGIGPTACTFRNPIGVGQDPWVVRRGDTYYFAESHNNAIWVHKAGWLNNDTSGGVSVWNAPSTGWNSTNIWAPELHYIDGSWYIY